MVSEKAKMNKLKKLDKLVDDIHGEGFFSDMASKVKRIINPVLTSMGIYSTDIGIDKPVKESEPSDTLTNQPAKQGYLETLLQGRKNYPPPARAILAKYGDLRIIKAVVIRQPIMAITPAIFNVASFGAFQETLDKQPYDTLFHLRSVFTLEGGNRVQVEKSEVIHIDTKIHQIKGQQEKEVQLPTEPLTINQLLDGAKDILKGNMFSYDAFKNNCQDFQLAIYRGANLLTPELETFIKQDVSEIASESPFLSKLANAITGIGGKFNELIHGAGINKKYNKNHLVQSILFDKKKWKTNEAVEWLQDNNYISHKVDITSHYLRFRQLDPKDYPKPHWHYTTHRLGNGIDFIILYRQSNKELPITTVKGMSKKQIHSIMTGSGDLIHIDLGSHNATGKSKNSMEGDGIQKLKFSKSIPLSGGALTNDQMNAILNSNIAPADLNGIIEGEIAENTARQRQPRQPRQPRAINIINPQAKPDDFATQYMKIKMLNDATKYTHNIPAKTKRKYTRKSDAEKIKIAREKLKLKLLKEKLKKTTTKKTTKKMKGGVLESAPQTQWDEMVGVPKFLANMRDSSKSMESYNPLDMKLSTQNVMLNNLKKSDLEDLGRLKTEAKRSMYDRDAAIQKIKSITKRRVKSEVKKVKTAKPRNLKTRGSPQAKIAALEKLNKSRKKRTKKITL
jgi:hypothetical protein